MPDSTEQARDVDSRCFNLRVLFRETYNVDFYQREYVWKKKQLEDLITDLSNAFLKCWKPAHKGKDVKSYDPYLWGRLSSRKRVMVRI